MIASSSFSQESFLNNLPLPLLIFDSQTLKILETNESFLEWVSTEDHRVNGASIIEFIANPRKEIARILSELQNVKSVTSDAIAFQHANGKYMLAETVWSKIEDPDKDKILVIVKGEIEGGRSDVSLRQRDQALETLASISQRLLRSRNIGKIFSDMLLNLGAILNLDQICFVKVSKRHGRILKLTLKYFWKRKGGTLQKCERSQEPDSSFVIPKSWLNALKTGQEIVGTVDSFPESEKSFFEHFDTNSVLLVPVFVENTWFGFLVCLDDQEKRIWQDFEIEILHTAANLMGAALKRQKMENEILKAHQDAEREAITLRSMISGMDGGVILIDQNDVLMEASDWFCHLVGRASWDLAGNRLWDIGPDLFDEKIENIIRDFKSSKETEKQVVEKSYKDMKLSMRLQPIRSSYGYHGTIINLTDVTHLVGAREAAEEANVAKSRFLASVSHELRTPLNGIIGMTDLALSSSTGNEEIEEYLQIIKRSANELLRLINDILDFSKLDTETLKLHPVNFSPHDLVQTLVEIIEPQAVAKGIHFCYSMSSDVPLLLKGDVERVHQIMLNILDNAVKFTDTGEIHFNIEVEDHIEEQVLLRFTVKDTGIGIPREKENEIFEPFSQVDDSLARRFGGTGLGLAICEKLVKIMNGEIWKEDNTEEGTTFHIILPFEITELEEGIFEEGSGIADLKIVVIGAYGAKNFDWNSLKAFLLKSRISYHFFPSIDQFRKAIKDESFEQDLPLVIFVFLQEEPPEQSAYGFSIKKELNLSPVTLIGVRTTSTSEDLSHELRNSFDYLISSRFKHNEIKALLETIVKDQLVDKIDAGAEKTDEPSPAVESGSQLSPHILLAEDNPVNQRLIQILLQKHGYRITTVSNGVEALNKLNEQPFDLIIADIQMPEMDGKELVKRIKKNDKWSHVPVIAMTAHDSAELENNRDQFEVDEILKKPVHPKDVVKTIRKWLRN